MYKHFYNYLRLYSEKTFAFLFVFLLIPGFFIYEITVVKDTIMSVFKPTSTCVIVNTITAFFLFINLIGNMFMAYFVDTRVTRSDTKKTNYCKRCKMWQPDKSFHCKICDVCIMRRDHHCIFLSRCIGINNLRYFILAIAYLALCLIFSCYWNFYYVTAKFDSLFYEIYRFFTTIRLRLNDYYTAFLLFNFISVCCASYVLWIHARNVFDGVTSYECNVLKTAGNAKWGDNFLRVFGTKWFYALIWPLAESPLPKVL